MRIEPPPTEPLRDENALRRAWWFAWAEWKWAVLAFVVALTAARIGWHIWLSRYTLIEDEAHYWEWSRRLAWSYYSKGPGVAWAIRAATEVFGTSEWAVRLPAAVFSGLGSLAAAGLARDLFADRRVALVAAVLYQCVPAFAVTSLLMTIDSPYLACWTLSCWAAWRAMDRGSPAAWASLGLGVAAGFLFKYTVLLLPVGVALAWVMARRDGARTACPSGQAVAPPRRVPAGLGALVALACAALGLVPVLLWNAQHDWATVRHLLGHLGMAGGDVPAVQLANRVAWSPLWAVTYIGMLAVTSGPVLFLAALGWINAAKAGLAQPARFCWALALPILGGYLLVSLRAETEGNWPIAGFCSLVPLAAWAVVDGVARLDRPIRVLWGGALACGLGVALGFGGLPALAKIPGFGPKVPVQRLTGLRVHAAGVRAQLDALRERTGLEPFVLSEHYGRASQLAFYLPGRPVVYCASAQVGGRKTQYDLWPETDLGSAPVQAALAGRPAVLMGGRPDQWEYAFTEVADLGPLAAEPKANRTSYAGLGYRGFAGWRPGWGSGGAKDEGQGRGTVPAGGSDEGSGEP